MREGALVCSVEHQARLVLSRFFYYDYMSEAKPLAPFDDRRISKESTRTTIARNYEYV